MCKGENLSIDGVSSNIIYLDRLRLLHVTSRN